MRPGPVPEKYVEDIKHAEIVCDKLMEAEFPKDTIKLGVCALVSGQDVYDLPEVLKKDPNVKNLNRIRSQALSWPKDKINKKALQDILLQLSNFIIRGILEEKVRQEALSGLPMYILRYMPEYKYHESPEEEGIYLSLICGLMCEDKECLKRASDNIIVPDMQDAKFAAIADRSSYITSTVGK